MSRVACETCCKTGMVMIFGEITTSATVNYEQVIRDAIKDIGYDDPAKGFVTNAEGVRKEAAAIGLAAQEEYRDGNPSPDGAFECFLKHFMEEYEELKAPDGSDFDLKTLLTFDLFEAELFSHARYKAVDDIRGVQLSPAG